MFGIKLSIGLDGTGGTVGTHYGPAFSRRIQLQVLALFCGTSGIFIILIVKQGIYIMRSYV